MIEVGVAMTANSGRRHGATPQTARRRRRELGHARVAGNPSRRRPSRRSVVWTVTVTERVHGGGTRVVRVALVDAVVGFDVTPDQLLMDRGTHLVLAVVNEGDEVHDLAPAGGARTDRLDPGQSQRLDLGVITSRPPEVYCTLPGHMSAGMTLDIQIQGQQQGIG